MDQKVIDAIALHKIKQQEAATRRDSGDAEALAVRAALVIVKAEAFNQVCTASCRKEPDADAK